ncbi:MAG: Nudix family hydrolase [Gammaproteobacteria bacterium]|nr:Nudix family hydrolase [Gammaproteobacteria bacterium]
MNKQLHVAVAVIEDTQGRILLTQRAADKHQGGLWEFPGGKCEAGEPVLQALARELQEELGIEVVNAEPLIQIPYQYPELNVLLDVHRVTAYRGDAHGAEGQPMQWVAKAQLQQIAFPAANRPIVCAVQLPQQYLVTPTGLDAEALYQGVMRAAAQGIELVQLRAPELSEQAYFALVERLLQALPVSCRLLIKGSWAQVQDYEQAGWHLTSAQLEQFAQQSERPLPSNRWLAVSCHNAQQLAWATQISADFACLSPVQATASHPDAQPLGWAATAELIAEAQVPVYLLGGLQPSDLTQARIIGAQGIAAIRGLWS